MITAQEAFEGTLSRSQKIKEEKLELVDTAIRNAVYQELFNTKFSFAQLKPFAGAVIEKLIELGYSVTQTGTFIFVSWDAKKEEKKTPVKAEASLKKTEALDESSYGNEGLEDDEDFDDSEETDFWNT